LFKIIKKESGFTLIEIVVIVTVMGIIVAIGLPKYIDVVNDTHNANINMVVGSVRSWSYMQAVDNFNLSGDNIFPDPSTATIENVVLDGELINWDDSNPLYWKYVAGGGINISGDGTYFSVKPVYVN